MMLVSVAVAVGGGLGALVRYFVSQRVNGDFPWGTILVNVAGSFLLGWYVAAEGAELLDSIYATGFLGALTTFSTLQFEAVSLFKRKHTKNGLLYLFLTYTLGLIAVWTGFILAVSI